MSSDTLALIVTIMGVTASATWVIRSQIAEVVKLFTDHTVSDAKEFAKLNAKIMSLDAFRKNRKR